MLQIPITSRLSLSLLLCLAACSPDAPARGIDGGDGETDGATREEQLDARAPDAGSEPEEREAATSGADGGSDSALRVDASTPSQDGALGAASFGERELDPASHGATITFQQIGATGWYPSRRDPAQGPCDAHQSGSCCLARREVTSDRLTPWDEELILTLRGPLALKQLAVYQPGDGETWSLVSAWDARAPDAARGLSFRGDGAQPRFAGRVGSECLVDVASARAFTCGSGSSPFCPSSASAQSFGWSGSKLFVLLASMPHAGQEGAGSACAQGSAGNWYDAPWLGLSLGELVRAGKFSDCHCYAKKPGEWWLGDGCGQFNAFEVVNDNNQYANLELFSTNFFGYGGYVGEGPCGRECDVSTLSGEVDLIDKGSHLEASRGALARPGQGPRAAFRRPTRGYRYFLILMNVPSREVQLAIVHPRAVPSALAQLLPALPASLTRETLDALLALRLPK